MVCACIWAFPILTSKQYYPRRFHCAWEGSRRITIPPCPVTGGMAILGDTSLWPKFSLIDSHTWLTPEPVEGCCVLTHRWRIMFMFIDRGSKFRYPSLWNPSDIHTMQACTYTCSFICEDESKFATRAHHGLKLAQGWTCETGPMIFGAHRSREIYEPSIIIPHLLLSSDAFLSDRK